jgi:hypothetical protein
VQWICGVCAVYKHFSGFGFFLLPNRVHARRADVNANRWAFGSLSLSLSVVLSEESMKTLFANRYYALIIVLLILVVTLLVYTGVQAQSGGPAGGLISVQPLAPALSESVPGGPGYVSLNGFNFKPFTPANNTYSWAGVGLKNTGSVPDWFMAPVQIPNGSTIQKMVVYYIDQDAGAGMNLEVDLVYVPLGANYGYMSAGFTSSGSLAGSVYGETTTIANPVVNLSANSYILQAYLPNSMNITLLGVRIDYGYQASLPFIKK